MLKPASLNSPAMARHECRRDPHRSGGSWPRNIGARHPSLQKTVGGLCFAAAGRSLRCREGSDLAARTKVVCIWICCAQRPKGQSVGGHHVGNDLRTQFCRRRMDRRRPSRARHQSIRHDRGRRGISTRQSRGRRAGHCGGEGRVSQVVAIHAPGAARCAQTHRRRASGTQGRARAAARARGGKDAGRGHRRDGPGRADLPVLCR